MRMRSKLTLILLIAGLFSAGTVGAIANWLVMRDFQQSVMDRAYDNFQEDVRRYLAIYGDWNNAAQQEAFHDFVRRHRAYPPPPDSGREPGRPAIDRRQQAPFRFIVLDPEGRVLKGLEEYPQGSMADPALLSRTRPVIHNGSVAVRIAPVGEPPPPPSDREYVAAMRKALAVGIAVAVLFALLIGVIAGERISSSIRALTEAIRGMRKNRETALEVEVKSRDEIGEMAQAFNQMSLELSRAHRELRRSSEMVQQQAQKLRELSIRDPLTHLFNRRHFEEQAHTLYQQAVRYQQPLTVMLGDLDHFKRINDNCSHAVGDEVLRQVSRLLSEGIRKSDLLARYGGEEFVILFPNSSLEQALHCCENLRRRIESHPWGDLHPGLEVTMSMGLCGKLALGNAERMVAEADQRLYAAKHRGRNRVVSRSGEAA